MRLAARSFRDVKLHRLALDLRLHLRPQYSEASSRGTRPRARYEHGAAFWWIRTYSAPAFGSDAVTDVPTPVVLEEDRARLPPPMQPPPQPSSSSPTKSLTQQNYLFGRWVALLSDSGRLAVETDFSRQGPAKNWGGPLLVDKIEHQDDLALWSALLEYQTRMNGDSGALKVWRALWGRKALYDIKSPLAPVFWKTILDAAVRLGDPKFLSDVYLYSEWMYYTHGVKWPHLYSTIITHLLKTHQHKEALRWHLQLIPNFYPGQDQFTDILKRFARDPELYRTFTLQSLYFLSPSRQLYDKLVPYFYEHGESALAISWREILIQRDDGPLLPVPVRPFLRFLQGYFPSRTLHPQEKAALSQDSDLAHHREEYPDVTRELTNRIDGGTFGISVKDYNDGLGAKWFASSWISLDTAISGVAALGIEQIGPLSFQSIALRERDCEGVSKRIKQLQNHGISVADSNYLRLLLYFLEIKDDELLFDLLKSDFHPDVFNDLRLLTQILESMMTSNDWRTYRLLLTARVVILKKTTREMANTILRACFLNRDQRGVFRALDDMRVMQVGIDRAQADLIYQKLYDEIPVNKLLYGSRNVVKFHLAVCMRLVSMDIPVPVFCWLRLIRALGKLGMLDDLETLCLELASLLTTSRSSRPGFIPVHLNDVPESMKAPLLGVENLLGVYVPEDLSTFAPLHPLRQIFTPKMFSKIIRWTFRAMLNKPADKHDGLPALSSQPLLGRPRRQRLADFHCARALRLIRLLRQRGVLIRHREVIRAVMPRLVELYGTEVDTKFESHRMRGNNVLSLADMKTLLDRAWSEDGEGNEFGPLLPPLEELRASILDRGHRRSRDNLRYLQSRSRTPLPSHPTRLG